MKNTTEDKEVKVEVYSGYKANERPICFVLKDRKVRDVLLQWKRPEKEYFKVLALQRRL